jgi:nicotinamidase-related amidase
MEATKDLVTPSHASAEHGGGKIVYLSDLRRRMDHVDEPSELMSPLAALCPPATVINKTRYSAFAESGLLAHLRERQADALIISGSETDACVLATVLAAVDLGCRVIVARDAVCSSSDEGHDMLMRLYHTRFTEQIETADTEVILARWP